MKLSHIVLLALTALALAHCGKEESGSKKERIHRDNLKGIWQLTHVRHVEDETTGEGADAKVKEVVREHPKDVELEQTKFLLVSKNMVNIMDYQGQSKACELNRVFDTSRMNVKMMENPGCYATVLRLKMQDQNFIELTGLERKEEFGPAKSFRYLFKRTDKVALKIFFKSLDLYEDSEPEAYKNYLTNQ